MILHINGNYPHHSLHSELVSKLSDMGYLQYVCIPMYEDKYKDVNKIDNSRIKYCYGNIHNFTDKVFFVQKSKKTLAYIEQSCDIKDIDCSIAHTLYSDGAVAYMLYVKYGIPYSLVVRDTDINIHMKLRPHLVSLMRKIVSSAKKVIFICSSYEEVIAKKFSGDEKNKLREKAEKIPNAVNNFWLTGDTRARIYNKPLRLIFVGELIRRKNVDTLIHIVAGLNKGGINSSLTIVGDGKEASKCTKLANKLNIKDKITMHGWQNGKEKLKNLYNMADIFLMLSFTETFGTVYIEAISQGIPILYTKGQGVDGYFDEGSVGYRCHPKDIQGAIGRIIKIMNDYGRISANCINESKRFSWDKVAKSYSKVIDLTINHRK